MWAWPGSPEWIFYTARARCPAAWPSVPLSPRLVRGGRTRRWEPRLRAALAAPQSAAAPEYPRAARFARPRLHLSTRRFVIRFGRMASTGCARNSARWGL
jgi:hypothetical protein